MDHFMKLEKMSVCSRTKYLLKNRKNPPMAHPAMQFAARIISANKSNRTDLVTGAEISQVPPLTSAFILPKFKNPSEFIKFAHDNQITPDYWRVYVLAWRISVNSVVCGRTWMNSVAVCYFCENNADVPHKHARLTFESHYKSYSFGVENNPQVINPFTFSSYRVVFGTAEFNMYEDQMLRHAHDAYNLRDYRLVFNYQNVRGGAYFDGIHADFVNLDFLENESYFVNSLEHRLARFTNTINVDFIDLPKIILTSTHASDYSDFKKLFVKISNKFGQPGVVSIGDARNAHWSYVENIGAETLYRYSFNVNRFIRRQNAEFVEGDLEIDLGADKEQFFTLMAKYEI